MSNSKKVVILSCVAGIWTVITAKLAVDNFILSLRVSFAEDQIATFSTISSQVEENDIPRTIEALEALTSYYPSGTKQVENSKLDRIVECCRNSAIREVIGYLRRKAGKDLGKDPSFWIQEFRKDRLEPSQERGE